MTNLPADLLALEARAWTEIQAGRLTVDTAEAVHAAVGEYAETAGKARLEVEEALKRAVRHGGG
ncbi:hypothetical protein GCM10010317_076510 [Streptomyces mirabilis]|uniref:hypothetical protein n=1 Tax=Streptomyces mirabilis TaxID=68239 RepID=UPI00167D4181|nr:hypothetical protein [Streptomyces mirabilis]GHD70050.1 hypothetical protein GCM10010317_076510 [Streptomyces mirabilis]